MQKKPVAYVNNCAFILPTHSTNMHRLYSMPGREGIKNDKSVLKQLESNQGVLNKQAVAQAEEAAKVIKEHAIKKMEFDIDMLTKDLNTSKMKTESLLEKLRASDEALSASNDERDVLAEAKAQLELELQTVDKWMAFSKLTTAVFPSRDEVLAAFGM